MTLATRFSNGLYCAFQRISAIGWQKISGQGKCACCSETILLLGGIGFLGGCLEHFLLKSLEEYPENPEENPEKNPEKNRF